MDFSRHLKRSKLTKKGHELFCKLIYDYFAENKRSFAWRETTDPYCIVISEIMLQQTQTDRVKQKYDQFIREFPTLEELSQASIAQVIAVWQGLGYNRRALAVHAFAQRVIREYNGIIPNDPAILETFKGIGYATARSICAFAYNMPTVFIETNVRAVFIHHFFGNEKNVKDDVLFPLVEQTLDQLNPREWYYALMDYGVMLKKEHKNPSRKSAHYATQSKFEGSDRQVRGLILKLLVRTQIVHRDTFIAEIPRNVVKIDAILADLEKEGFVAQKNDLYCLVQSKNI